MSRRRTSRILISGTFLVSVMIGAEVTAQMVAHPSTSGTSQQTPSSKSGQNHAAVEQNPACQRIISECKKLGFIQGQWKEDNGLWKDCFDPVVKGGGHATRDGKPITVPVSSSDVQACRASEGHHKQAQ
jgi:hypothetical protein